MRIAFDINGVLRDTFLKAEQLYQKFYIDEFEEEKTSSYNEETEEFTEEIVKDDFKYELNLPVKSLDNLEDHFRFKDKEDLFNFFYVDFPMQIFGHAPSISGNTFNVLNDIYEELRDDHELLIVSDEIQKSKPASLFFLSKYGSLIEKIKFYSNITIDSMWDEVDILVTANPNHILNSPEGKTIIKYKTTYNEDIDSKFTIENLEDFKELYNQIQLK
jgi:hypothetical protein